VGRSEPLVRSTATRPRRSRPCEPNPLMIG
jgi:hypothetical protein